MKFSNHVKINILAMCYFSGEQYLKGQIKLIYKYLDKINELTLL